jgi:MoaA/NifB/PqqE/SkfB family radical SAM enzyme
MFNFTKTTIENIKNFKYEKGKMNLKFSLNVENKSELKDFLELLKVAQEDVEKEINVN